MKLFEIDNSLITKVIGAYPQSEDMVKGYNYDAKDSVHELVSNRNSKLNFTPNLNSFLLKKKTRYTDLIGAIPAGGASGLLISEKFKQILETTNIIEHQFFVATVINSAGQNERYYWLQLISELCKKVNYVFSKFYRSGGYEFEVNSLGDFLLKDKQLGINGQISSKEIAIDYNHLRDLDMFHFGNFDLGIYVSENLKNAIENENITGINITEVKTEIVNKNNSKLVILRMNSFNDKYRKQEGDS